MSTVVVAEDGRQFVARQIIIDGAPWWIVHQRIRGEGQQWEPVSGGFLRESEAVAEARRLLRGES